MIAELWRTIRVSYRLQEKRVLNMMSHIDWRLIHIHLVRHLVRTRLYL